MIDVRIFLINKKTMHLIINIYIMFVLFIYIHYSACFIIVVVLYWISHKIKIIFWKIFSRAPLRSAIINMTTLNKLTSDNIALIDLRVRLIVVYRVTRVKPSKCLEIRDGHNLSIILLLMQNANWKNV